MALQATYTTFHGNVLPSAYIRVEQFSGSKHEVNVLARVYENKDAEAATEDYTFAFTHDLTSASNILIQAYNELKTHSAFELAIDV